ncbi:hypothetical protein WA556_000299 [Blastocystis sp. ATCC 50177/Nand II]
MSCIALSIVWTMLTSMFMPNMPFILRSYKEHLDESVITTYTAIITAVFFIGQTFGGIMWGMLADRIGRKPALILTLMMNVICNTVFGFCDSVKMAMVIRFFTGLLDGTIPVCKTIQTEVSTPETIGFVSSLFFVGGAIGGIIGPTLGGFLSKEENIPALIRLFPILKRFPYATPLVICAILFILVIIVVLIWTEETLPRKKRVHSSKLGFRDSFIRSVSSPLLAEDLEMSVPTEKSTSPLWECLRTKDAILIMTAYALISLVSFSFLTIFSVAITSPIPHYGMSLDSEQASLLSSIASPFQLMLPLLIPYLDKLILYRTIFGISMLISSIMPLLYPLLCETIHLPTAVMFFFATCFTIVNLFSMMLMMNAIMVLSANIAYHEVRGAIMGISETIACVTRCIGPVLFSLLCSWTLKQPHGVIVNPYLTFIILGIIGLLTTTLAFWISPETNVAKHR